MTAQEKRLKNAAHECAEVIKAGVLYATAISRVARAYNVNMARLVERMQKMS